MMIILDASIDGFKSPGLIGETAMPDAWDERKRALEEEYFRKKDQEAIEKLRAQRAAREAQTAPLQCPRCDGTLAEVALEDVLIDRCTKCNGVWLDAGELERLTAHEQTGGWFARMRQALSGD
jgi:Zn-finger nucleic acid-binding protein